MEVLLNISLTLIMIFTVPYIAIVCDGSNDNFFSPFWRGYKIPKHNESFVIKFSYWFPFVVFVGVVTGLITLILWVILHVIWGV